MVKDTTIQKMLNRIKNLEKRVDELEHPEIHRDRTVQYFVDKCRECEKQKKGTWIEDEEQKHVEITYHCSTCGFQVFSEFERTRYCPNCGEEKENPYLEQPIIPNGDIFKAIYPIGTVLMAKTPPEIGEWKEIGCCTWRRDK